METTYDNYTDTNLLMEYNHLWADRKVLVHQLAGTYLAIFIHKKGGTLGMRKHIMILLSLSLVLLTGCGKATEQESTYRQITMDEAIVMMEEESNYIILDVRTPQEFYERHIPGAINIPNETIDKNEITDLPDKEQLILVYCRSGNRSKQASEKLVKLGYTNIVEFGGINDWPGETVRK